MSFTVKHYTTLGEFDNLLFNRHFSLKSIECFTKKDALR